MSAVLAADDVAPSWAAVAPGARPPLVVLDALTAFLDARGLGSGPIEMTPLGDGHSNITLLLARGGRELVLRRPPRPPVPPSAHDMLREARVIGALRDTPVPVAHVLATCEDPSVIGVPFCVMERVPGRVIEGGADGHTVADELVGALAALHAVDWRAIGLGGLARPTGYLERQLRRFIGSWEHNRTRELPEVDSVAAWLYAHLPAAPETTIVHGDFRLGNALFEGDTLTAVLDWELATLGAPLSDLGYLLSMWSEPEDPPWTFDLSPVTRQPGYPRRRDLLERYVRRSGREVESLAFYVTLALWKNIVIMEGNYRRALEGASDDPFLRDFGDGVVDIARRAYRIGPGGEEIV